VEQRQVADHEAGGVDRIRLEVVGIGRVANVGIGKRDDLPPNRGISEDLLVTVMAV